MPAIDSLRAFDIATSVASLWVFKKSFATGTPRFTGHWVETTAPLDDALKQAVLAERGRIEEVQEYGLLAQNNEASALLIDADVTHAGLIVDAAAGETPNRQARELKQIRNSAFYVIKLVNGEDVVYAVKKTDPSWKTTKAGGILSVVFRDERLTLDDSPSFDVSKRVDFFIVEDKILISNKDKFESILSYKETHKEDFAKLRAEPNFIAVISDMTPLIDFVGDNKIQLRRASAIRQKAHYADMNFMNNLRAHCAASGLNIQFDAHGRITPTAATCREIFQALLDHRLASRFSNMNYDVENAVTV